MFSGKLYPSSFDLLDKEVVNCFLHAEGPGELPSHRKPKRIFGILSPYGNFQEIGHVCAWAYQQAAECAFPYVFVILGRKSDTGFSTYLFSGWQTPFGVVESDKEHGQRLLQAFPALKNETAPFDDCMEIETQLPFLQFAGRDKLQEIRIIPILVNSRDYDACQKLGEAIGELSEQCSLCVICSSNLFGEDVDGVLIEALKNIDGKKMKEIAGMKNIGEIAVFFEAMKSMFAPKGRLLHYSSQHAAMVF